MKVFAKILAVFALALTPVVTAHAQPFGRGGERRGEARREEPRRYEAPRVERERREPYREPYRAPGYAAPPRAPAYPYPAPARPYAGYPAPAHPPAQAYPPAQGYRGPPPGYAPNSLGADWAQQQDQARRGVRQGGLMPLRSVMSMIRNRTPGRLLDAGLEPGPDGRPAYRVRWAAQGGQRIDFIVDAATGAILRRNGY